MTSPPQADLCVTPSNPVPEGARVGYFRTSDGVRLRYGLWPRTGPVHKGTVCLVQGRTEFIEKYFETIADFQKRGFAVATFDFRGQGFSDRLIANTTLGHVEAFSDYCVDLASFHAEIVLPDCPPPFYLVGHSMGGLACLLTALRDRLMFDRMVLSAPMLGLDGMPFGPAGAARVLAGARFFGLSHVPLGRRADRIPGEDTFAANPLTSDLGRYMRGVEIFAAEPRLAVGAPTIGWISAALEGMAQAAADDFPQRLRVPTLMLAAARDEVVSTPAIETLGLRLRTGRHMVIPAARHELFMETDTIRAQVFAAFDAFITEQSE